jgi:hypothetical protein
MPLRHVRGMSERLREVAESLLALPATELGLLIWHKMGTRTPTPTLARTDLVSAIMRQNFHDHFL